jgi:hypothetical protein
MKRMFVVMLALIMILSLAACGDEESSGDFNRTTKPADIQATDPSETAPKMPATNEVTEEFLRNYPVASGEDFTYSSSRKIRGGIRIDSYTGSSDIVVIPGEIDGKPVVEISYYVFANDSNVRAVWIPDAVETISGMFGNNANLEIVIAEGAKEVVEFAFGYCSALREVIFGDHLEKIDNHAFSCCEALVKLNIPASLTEMTEMQSMTAFMGCTNLTIYGEAGSYIEEICQQQGIPFVAE